MPRISTLTLYDSISSAIALSQQRVLKLQQGLGDGRAIHAPSDDPVQAHQAMWFREQIRGNTQYQRNVDGVLSTLSAGELALSQIQDVLGEVSTLQTSGSDDSIGGEGRKALASRLDQIVQNLAELGNTRYAGLYLFGGRATLSAPLQIRRDAGGKVTGVDLNPASTGGIKRAVGTDVILKVNVVAEDVFGKGGEAFKTLIRLRDALSSNSGDEVRNLSAAVEKAQDGLNLASTLIGSLMARAEGIRQTLEESATSYENGRSQAEDLPAAKAVVEFQSAQTALSAALSSGSKILNLTLLDYL